MTPRLLARVAWLVWGANILAYAATGTYWLRGIPDLVADLVMLALVPLVFRAQCRLAETGRRLAGWVAAGCWLATLAVDAWRTNLLVVLGFDLAYALLAVLFALATRPPSMRRPHR